MQFVHRAVLLTGKYSHKADKYPCGEWDYIWDTKILLSKDDTTEIFSLASFVTPYRKRLKMGGESGWKWVYNVTDYTPIYKPNDKYWELCMTMNDSWGFQGTDKNYKTPFQVIRIFTDVISLGGNLLLDIGPKADGTIPEEQLEILEELGKWTKKT